MTTNVHISESTFKRAANVLVGFGAEFGRDLDHIYGLDQTHLERRDFPVPGMLLLLMRDALGCKSSGYEEKVRWTVYASFRGEPFAIQLAKFGLRMWHASTLGPDVPRIVAQLQAALKHVERGLKPLVDEQFACGNVSMENLAHEFSDRYRFFRDHAAAAFARSTKPGPRFRTKSVSEGFAEIARSFNVGNRERRDGFYFSVAMIDAFFSGLEHRLILMRAFSGSPLKRGELKDFLRARWNEKYVQVVGTAHESGQLLGRLRALKEQIRNPFAHGGIENDNGSMFCHVPGLGALPGNLSDTQNSARFNFIPVGSEDYASACALFDEVEVLLSAGKLEVVHTLIESGLPIAWDSKKLKEYRELAEQSPEDLQAYINYSSDQQDRHDNMDY